MLYYVQPNDTLYGIARRFGVTLQDLLAANVICNPNLIMIGLPLIIPISQPVQQKAGGRPYYILRYGDTLWCIASQFGTTVTTLARANQIQNPNIVYTGTEILVAPEIIEPHYLVRSWKETAEQYCDIMTPMMEYGIFYLNTFQWEALGPRALPYLLPLLKHPCPTVRFYTLISLGRLGISQGVLPAVESAATVEPEAYIREMAAIVLHRIGLVQTYGKRIHVTTRSNHLLAEPNFDAARTEIQAGMAVIVLFWNIPSPTGEEGPRGGLQSYDQIMIVQTGQIGFMPRLGFDQITFI